MVKFKSVHVAQICPIISQQEVSVSYRHLKSYKIIDIKIIPKLYSPQFCHILDNMLHRVSVIGQILSCEWILWKKTLYLKLRTNVHFNRYIDFSKWMGCNCNCVLEYFFNTKKVTFSEDWTKDLLWSTLMLSQIDLTWYSSQSSLEITFLVNLFRSYLCKCFIAKIANFIIREKTLLSLICSESW